MSGVAITVRGLVVHYDDEAALDGLDLEVPSGEITAVVGPSGAGKSTLLQIVAGLLEPDRGDVLFDGRSVLGLAPERRDLGVVFQSYALFPHLTVEDNVAFGLRVRGGGRAESRRRVASILERLEIGRLARRLPSQLSGGEQQRVALARALAFGPRAVLLDEPLAALDARLRLDLREELRRRLTEAGVTALYVTHDQEEAMALGDRVAVLAAGRLEQVGSPEELYHRPASRFVAEFVGEASFLEAGWEPAAGGGRLETVLGELVAERSARSRLPAASGRVTLMVRPEAIRPSSGSERPTGNGVVFRARPIESTFLGGRWRVVLVAEAGPTLEADLPGREPPPEGASLWTVAAEDLVPVAHARGSAS